MTTHERAENLAQLAILLAVASMAGAASFTHVHDWTMTNSPDGTGDWFGWANAIISELTPTAAALEIRRRKRHHQPVAYPMTVLAAAAALSIAAQLAVAKPGPTGWLLSTVPALAFLALTKLILSPPTSTSTNTSADEGQDHEPTAIHATAERPALPESRTVPGELVTSARMADFAHRQTHGGHPITAAELAEHLDINEHLAATALTALDGTPTGERP